MSEFPTYAGIILDGYKESIPEPSVRRTEMERGPAFQEVINRRVYQNIDITVLFETKAAIQLFDNWYLNDIKRAAFFSFRHPRTRQVVQARLPGGKIGDLIPAKGGFGISTRNMTLEYMS